MAVFILASLAAGFTHLTGFGLVCLVLVILWCLTSLMSRILGKAGDRSVKTGSPTVPAISNDPGGPTEEELAAIAGAMSILVADPHRITSVEPVVDSLPKT
jgi:Na+-transporting methylmalonyl-CoA/oxaloacetate decarboxylase gamma subunit